MNDNKKRLTNQAVYYISQGSTPDEHLSGIRRVLDGGVRLVQLRMKETPIDLYMDTARQAVEACQTFGATLIINDLPEIVSPSGAHGVHLGQRDQAPQEARPQLPSSALLGGTANTLDDCRRLIASGVDYIGLGPYRFTTTKERLSPILGLEGYQKIVGTLRREEHDVPIYAIGGIELNDVEALSQMGITGIALSGYLYRHNDPGRIIRQIQTYFI